MANIDHKAQKYFDNQFDDEEVLFVVRKHPIVMRKGLILGVLGPLAGIIPAAIKPSIGMNGFWIGLVAGIILGFILFFPSWISWFFSVLIITDQRLIQITQHGFFHRHVDDLSLSQIQSVSYEVSGLEETLLGFGTIRMQTYVGELSLYNIHHPERLHNDLISVLRKKGVQSPVPLDGNQDDRPDSLDEEEIED